MKKLKSKLRFELIKSGIWTAILTVLFLAISWNEHAAFKIFSALSYFIVLYFLFFSIGKEEVSKWMRSIVHHDIKKAVLFPTLLIVLYYSYIIINGHNPLKGTVFMLPFLIYFPTLVFVAKDQSSQKIDWLDFATLILFLLPTTLVEFSPNTQLPFDGSGFDSVYRLAIILTAVYSFVVIRDIKDVGFFPVFKWKYLGIALSVWLAFYAFVYVIGYSVDFIEYVGYDKDYIVVLSSIGISILGVFLHTAIFEELFFRGLLQNMLAKRIAQEKTWKPFWKWGSILLIVLSLITGYTMDGSMQWFPALITIFLCLAAYFIERSGISVKGTYTALAIASVLFGLVHYHSGSIIFVGLASIGGWAYGYTYIKTKNVLYAALVHALVNSSHIIFGLALMK